MIAPLNRTIRREFGFTPTKDERTHVRASFTSCACSMERYYQVKYVELKILSRVDTARD